MSSRELLDQLLSAADLSPQKLYVKSLKTDVWIRAISGDEGLQMSAEIRAIKGEDQQHVARERAAVSLSFYLGDEAGARICESLIDARKLITKWPLSALNFVVSAGQKLNATDEDAPAQLEKNSEPSR